MKHSLKGLRILNTRPSEQAQKLTQDILAAGGSVIELPTLEIQATDTAWVNNLPDLKKMDYAIFISANAVHYCFKQLKSHLNWPLSIKIIAIGRGSAHALHEYNIPVYALPELPDSEHLLALETLQHLKKQNVLLFKGIGGRTLIEEQLVQRGANLFVFNVYQRVMPQKINTQLIHSIWQDDLVDIILLTSEQSLHNLFKLFDQKAHEWLRNKSWLTLSDRLARMASAMKIKKIKISHPDRMINTLFDYRNKD